MSNQRGNRRLSLTELTQLYDELRKHKKDGDVLLDGLFIRPDLSVGYAKAARILVSGAQQDVDLMPPAFFSARHAVELALKDLLHIHHENELDQQRIDAHDGLQSHATPLSEKQLHDIGRTHDLGWLLQLVNDVMPQYFNSSWRALVDHIDSYEKGSPEWARYRERRVGRGKKAELVSSFDEPQLIRLNSLIDEVQAFMRETAIVRPEPQDPWSVIEELGLYSQHLTQEMYTRGMLD